MVKESYIEENLKRSENLVTLMKENQLLLAIMESCTGGFFSGFLSSVKGAGQILVSSTTVYSDEAKIFRGVAPEVIQNYGSISMQTSTSLAIEARKLITGRGLGVGITGRLPDSHGHTTHVYLGIASSNGNYASYEIVHQVMVGSRFVNQMRVVSELISNVENYILENRL
ncbi:MAG: CinA family protein [Candidatus Cloacimonetes bacterium]|nr:CinA family protein [Candidatus Cloacimonadota bacterium]